MPRGIIRRLITGRGFGFIRTEWREDLFFHRSQFEGVDFDSLREGQQVEFEVSQGPDGSCAVKVRLTQSKGEQQ